MKRRLGQSTVELAVALPVILALVFGTIDVGRAYYVDMAIQNASGVGARIGSVLETYDIGAAIRQDAYPIIPNNQASWGSMAAGQSNADCTSASQHCGDPNGCTSFTGTQVACFAIETCTLSGGDTGTSTCNEDWQKRPEGPAGAHGLQVIVKYKFNPVTPFVQALNNNNPVVLTATSLAIELYF